MPRTITYNSNARRFAFRNKSGGYSFVSEGFVRGVVDDDIGVSGARMTKIGSDLQQAAQRFKDGKIDNERYQSAVRDWRDHMAAQTKGAYLGQGAAAVGGIGKMGPRENGRCGGLLRVQYGYLENAATEFAADPDLVLGLVPGRPGADVRSGAYAESSRYVFEKMADEADGENGKPWIINLLENAAHCHTKPGQQPHLSCPGQTALGAVRYDDARRLPPGSRLCNVRCKCNSMRFATKKAALAAL